LRNLIESKEEGRENSQTNSVSRREAQHSERLTNIWSQKAGANCEKIAWAEEGPCLKRQILPLPKG